MLGGGTVFQVSLAATLTGAMEVVYDGDTFEIRGQRVRLKGIDAPEMSQTCQDDRERSYACGDSAANYLKQIVASQPVQCRGDEKDKYGRLIANCYIGGRDINREMVNAGWAVAYRRYDVSYVADEDRARAGKRGLWQGRFTEPEAFRSASWQKARKVVGKQGEDCLVKGNINARGVRIYHTPWGSKHYKKVKISANKGERWFCSEAEAVAAGWRAPYK